MEEEIQIINSNTRNEKIKNFFLENKRKIIIFFLLITIFIIGFFIFLNFKEKKKIELANYYNDITLNFSTNNISQTKEKLIEVIYKNDSTYSPLALYFLIDNEVLSEKNKVNKLFDEIIDNVNLSKEIKDLIIYKKGLFNADISTENELIKILSPITNSQSIWKSHALYLIAEFFYSKNEKNKAKEFLNKIINQENGNLKIKMEAQKRINRDFK